MALLTGIILLIVGLIACFFGKRLYRVVLALSGFVAGYYAASAALVQQSDVVQIVGAIIIGLVVAFIFWTLYKFAYILFGLFLGLALGAVVANAFNLDGAVYLIAVVILGVIGAIAGGVLADLMIRLATAFGGASQAISGLGAIAVALGFSLPLAAPAHTSGASADSAAGIVTLVLVIVLGIVGYSYQTHNDTPA